MRYSEETIQNVIEANDIVDVISQYVTLKRSGHAFMGCCPFHNEKTPSFSVSREKQLYHCFGCGVGGNVIGFVMAMENLSFVEALEYLAERAGIELPKQRDPVQDEQYQKKERIYELHRQLANHYFTLLKTDKEAQKYLAKRGFDAKTIRTFGIGFCGEAWQDAVEFLNKAGFTQQEMMDSGTVARGKNGKLYDRFRNRIMIPIQNARGKIIGFGGRKYLPSDESHAKYLNSPETMVFSKSYELFNLNRARKKVAGDQLIIVEGYMDVIALWQYGVENAVAALGTAFTPYHAKTLSRYAKEVVLCFDGDAAGESATVKALEVLKRSAAAVRIIRLGEADDPDSYIRKNGVEAFRARLRDADTVMDFQLAQCLKNNDVATSDGKIKYLNEAIARIRTLNNPVEEELYAKKVARVAGVSEQVVLRECQQKNRGVELAPVEVLARPAAEADIPKAYGKAQAYVLKSMFHQEDTALADRLDASDFSAGFYRKLFVLIKELKEKEKGGPLSLPLVMEGLDTAEEKSAFSQLSFESYGDGDTSHLAESILTIQYYHYQEEIQQIRRAIALLDEQSPQGVQLMKELTAIKKELSKIQEVRNGG